MALPALSLMRWVTVFVYTVSSISARGPPRVIGNQHSTLQAKLGKSIKLQCSVETDIMPFIKWTKDNHQIDSGWTRFKTLQEGRVLRIKAVEFEDAGTYICKVTNGFGSVHINYSLSVLDEKTGKEQPTVVKDINLEDSLDKDSVAPKFEHVMKNANYERPVGSSVRFKCKARGTPLPHIFWRRGSDEVIAGKNTPHSTKKRKWILKIDDIQMRDSGNYTCVVSNSLGTISYTYTLDVIEKLNAKPEFIAPHPINTTVRYGRKASFQCRVKSAVQPHMQWLKRIESPSTPTNLNTTIEVSGMKLMVLQTDDPVTTPDGSHLNKLVIHRATEADAGMYICLGANSIGYNYRSAYLTVVRDEPIHNSDESTLPLIIAVPVCVVVVLIIVAVYMRRRICCGCCGTSSNDSQRQRFPVPTQDPYPPMHNPHMMPVSRDKLAPKSHSVDFYSDISSVSRQHYHPPPSHYS